MHTKYSFNPLLTESIIVPVVGAGIGLVGGAFIAGKLNTHELYHYILSEVEKNPNNKVKFVNEAISYLKKQIAELKRRDAADEEAYAHFNSHDYNDYNYGIPIKMMEKRLAKIKVSVALDNEDFAKFMVKNWEFSKSLVDKYQDIGNNHRVRNLSLAAGGLAAGAFAHKGLPYAKALAKRIHL